MNCLWVIKIEAVSSSIKKWLKWGLGTTGQVGISLNFFKKTHWRVPYEIKLFNESFTQIWWKKRLRIRDGLNYSFSHSLPNQTMSLSQSIRVGWLHEFFCSWFLPFFISFNWKRAKNELQPVHQTFMKPGMNTILHQIHNGHVFAQIWWNFKRARIGVSFLST